MFVHILHAEKLTDFVLNDLKNNDCRVNSLGRQREYLPLEKRLGLVTAHYGRFKFSKLRIPLP